MSQVGVAVSPAVFGSWLGAKFCTAYWFVPGVFPFAPLQATTGLSPRLQSDQEVPPSDGIAFEPLTSMAAAMPVFVIVIG